MHVSTYLIPGIPNDKATEYNSANRAKHTKLDYILV